MGLNDYNALARDYAVNGPPMRWRLALYTGWKPKPKVTAADVFGPADFANFLSQYPGGQLVAPPTE